MTRLGRKLYSYGVAAAALAVLCALIFPSPTSATINPQISFQGKLTNPDGTNLTNNNYTVRFRIYNHASNDAANTCSANSCLWEETKSVAVADGIFQTSLGDTTTLPGSVDFNTASLYLGVKVGSDAEMTPRIRFTASPYAFNSDRLGGIASTGFVQLSPGAQQTGFINISGNITAAGTINGNTFTNNSLLFGGSSAASIQSAASQTLQIDSGTAGTLSLGATNASGITLGKSGSTITMPGTVDIDSGSTVPTVTQLVVDNTTSTGVVTNDANGMNIKFKGGAAAVEAAGLRIDFAPGTTTGGTWSGMRVIAGATGAATGVTQFGIKLDGPTTPGAGTETAVRVASGWDIGIDIQSGGMQLATMANDPAAPAAGNLRIYAKDIAGRVMPKWIGPAGVDTPIQASLGFNRVALAIPNTTVNCSTTGFDTLGTGITGAGTCTVPALASTNLLTSIRRMNYATANASGSLAYHRQNSLMVWRGNAAGLGGYFFTTRFATPATNTGNRYFVGLSDSIANPTNVSPTTNTTPGKIGMAIIANTGTWNIVHNVTGTAPTVIALSASFPVDNTSLYELVLFAAPNGSGVGYRVTNISTGAQTSGTITTNQPANTTFLNPVMWTSNTTNGIISFDFAGWYLESDN